MVDLRKLADEELVNMFIKGSEACIPVLIERHKNKIYSYILNMVKNQELAEDIFQDTFIKVISTLKRGKYTDNGKFSSWAMRIAHNLIIDYYRKQKNQRVISNDSFEYDLFNSKQFAESTIEDNLIEEQIKKDLVNLLNFLPDNQKEVIKLRHFMGLSYKEIAEETGVSINTALGRMRYALINLRTIIEEQNITLTAS